MSGFGSKKLIQDIKTRTTIDFFLDLKDYKVFQSVSGRHMVFKLTKQSAEEYNFKYFQINNENLSYDIINTGNVKNTYVTSTEIQSKAAFKDGKILVLKNTSDFLKEDNIILLGQICEVSQGIVEASDRVSKKMLKKSNNKVKVGQGIFVYSKNELNTLNPNENEKQYLKKYLDASDVSKYHYKWNNNYVWYVGNKENKFIIKNRNKYKNMTKYLDSMKSFITSSNKPYGVHRTREQRFFTSNKLLCINMIDKPCFAFCDKEFYVNLSFNVIINKDDKYDLKLVLGIINSKFGEYWFNTNAKKRGINIDIGVETMRKFPIKKIVNEIDKSNSQKIINIVNEITALYESPESNKREICFLEDNINTLIYQLYSLTEAEIKIIEESTK